jgi:hypothetical protein
MTFNYNAPDLDPEYRFDILSAEVGVSWQKSSFFVQTVDVARERDLFVSVQDSLIDVAADHGFQKHSCKFIRGFLHASRFSRQRGINRRRNAND